MQEQALPRDLGDGLVLRRATPADSEALADFSARVHSDEGWDQPDQPLALWVQDLTSRPHPTCNVEDFALVEDTRQRRIASMMCLIPQTWEYDGVAIPVGRPELVGTHPDYRRRGLVRAQFEVIHSWCAERGHMVQGITGIPWYYRQFGYEMALTLGGGRKGYPADIPTLKPGEEETYRIRSASEADLAFLRETDDWGRRRYLVSCRRDEALWRHELNGRTPGSSDTLRVGVIVTRDGDRVGYVLHPESLHRDHLDLSGFELARGVSWLNVTPTVLRYLRATGEAYASADDKRVCKYISLDLGAEHPAYAAAPWCPVAQNPYAWYLRVADLAGFLKHIAPAIERRLDDSIAAGHSGELTLGFYRSGLRLVFQAGRLTTVEPWQPETRKWGMARFPDLTFLQLLFGYRSLQELLMAFPDCGVSSEARPLVEALFPKRPSQVWGVE